jgi:hypothetical protein
MARKDESPMNLLTRLPWWMSLGLAVIAYPVFRFAVPSLFSGRQVL